MPWADYFSGNTDFEGTDTARCRPVRRRLMDSTSVSCSLDFGKQERLLDLVYLPPHIYEDGTHDGQAIVVALFEDPTVSNFTGYAIREYSLKKGEMFYRFPKEGGHWNRAVIRQEWYRETETALLDSIFEDIC
jgi:hypothetical protein